MSRVARQKREPRGVEHISIPIRRAIHRLAVASSLADEKPKPCCRHAVFDQELRGGIPYQVCRECGHEWMVFDLNAEGL